jgi:GNAT superfamily N-acetyltransferase
MSAEFNHSIELTPSLLSRLESIIRLNHASKFLHGSVCGLSRAKSIQFTGLYVKDELASFACIMPRRWILPSTELLGFSIGLVTTLTKFRHQGFASLLLNQISEYAKESGAAFLYLQGIPNFYSKLSFHGFAPKCKFLFEKCNLGDTCGSVVPLTIDHISVASQLWDNYRNSCGVLIRRSPSEWTDLLCPLASTFLFFQPWLVLDSSNSPVAYFSTSPDNPATIREFVPSLTDGAVSSSLGIIANLARFDSSKTIEIFSPLKGPLLEYAATCSGADFSCFIRPRSSNMIRWLVQANQAYDLSSSFVFQGDNL